MHKVSVHRAHVPAALAETLLEVEQAAGSVAFPFLRPSLLSRCSGSCLGDHLSYTLSGPRLFLHVLK